MWPRFLLFLLNLFYVVYSEKACAGFGYNWAAEIRCLRAMLSQCNGEARAGSGGREVRSNTRQYQPAPKSFEVLGRWPTSHVTTTSTTASTTTLTPPPTRRETVACERCISKDSADSLSRSLTAEFTKRLTEMQRKMEGEMRLVEEKAVRTAEDQQRKSDGDLRKLMKRIKILTSRVYRFSSYEYIFVDEKESWYNAQEQCNMWGGHLTSVESEEENNFIKGIHSTTVWLALNDVQRENQFVNCDHRNATYKNWLEGQPDNANHNENCIEMDKNGKWSDQFCLASRAFVCKR